MHSTGIHSDATQRQEDSADEFVKKLHDGLGGLLTSLVLELKTVGNKRTLQIAEMALAELSRVCNREHQGNAEPLTDRINQYARIIARPHDLELEIEQIGETQVLSTRANVAADFAIREALTNAAKHSKATRVRVSIHYRPESVVIQVCDNGRGMTPGRIGHGLRNIRTRVAAAGGRAKMLVNPSQRPGLCWTLEFPASPPAQ